MNKLITILVLLSVALLSGCYTTTENGKHSGQITALEKTGMFWKTWEVYIKSDISSSQEEQYCVEKESLLPILEKVSKDKQRVTLEYHSEFLVAPWRCESFDIIDDVDIIEEEN